MMRRSIGCAASSRKIWIIKTRISGVWKLAPGQMHPIMALSSEHPSESCSPLLCLLAKSQMHIEISRDLSCMRTKGGGFHTVQQFSLDGIEEKFIAPLGGFRLGSFRCTQLNAQSLSFEVRRPAGLSTLDCMANMEEGGQMMKLQLATDDNTFTIYFNRAHGFPKDASRVHASYKIPSSERRRKVVPFSRKLATVPEAPHCHRKQYFHHLLHQRRWILGGCFLCTCFALGTFERTVKERRAV